MPTIKLLKRKQSRPTINGKLLHRWYNLSKWRKLRDVYARENPLCELCLAKGVTTPVAEIHHKIPIDVYEPDEALIYDWDNLQSLCVECHHGIHTGLRRFAHDEHMKARR